MTTADLCVNRRVSVTETVPVTGCGRRGYGRDLKYHPPPAIPFRAGPFEDARIYSQNLFQTWNQFPPAGLYSKKADGIVPRWRACSAFTGYPLQESC